LIALAGTLIWLARRKDREQKNKLAHQSMSSGMLGDGSTYNHSDWGIANSEGNRFSNMSHFTSPTYAKLSHQPGGDQFVYQQQGPIELDSTQQVGPQELPTENITTEYGGYAQYEMDKPSDK
jgi:hypothetical protein